jgi:Cys-rich repeat protein
MKTLALLVVPLIAACAPVADDAGCTPACGAGSHCEGGACVADAPPDLGGVAPDLGACNPGCGGLTPHCNATHHCVGCITDAQCPSGTYCKVTSESMAGCVVGCTDDARCGGGKCCGGRCVDTTSDAANCGACGASCGGAHAAATCEASMCKPAACQAGWGDCDADAANGCEANLHADAANCGSCGRACSLANAYTGCSDGCYLAACKFGFDDCNNNEGDGCETAVSSDPKNCGGCGAACKPFAHASTICGAGQCMLGACQQGWFDCDGDPKNGCEANLSFDSKNCGACGKVCDQQNPACAQGQCGGAFGGLLAYWKFDGDFNDSVGNHALSASDGKNPPGFAAGKLGQGTNSPMGDPQNLWLSPLPPEIDNNHDFTLAFWARNNAKSWYDSYAVWDSGGFIIYRHQAESWRIQVWTQDVNNQAVQIDSGVALPALLDPTWFFVVVWRSGNTIGVSINNSPAVTRTVGTLKNGANLFVSRMASGYSWPGQLDEMGYWSRALSQGEIDLLYNGGNGRTFP